MRGKATHAKSGAAYSLFSPLHPRNVSAPGSVRDGSACETQHPFLDFMPTIVAHFCEALCRKRGVALRQVVGFTAVTERRAVLPRRTPAPPVARAQFQRHTIVAEGLRISRSGTVFFMSLRIFRWKIPLSVFRDPETSASLKEQR